MKNSNYDWPLSKAFIDLAGVAQITDGTARCTAVAICDDQQPARHFYQGQQAHFYYEFEVSDFIATPAGGLEIIDLNGGVIHGKNAYQYNITAPDEVAPGTRLRYHHVIHLELGAGEYTFAVTLASVDSSLYSRYQQGTIAEHEFRSRIRERCRVQRAGTFSIGYHPTAKLLHHGLANLPGRIESQVIAVEHDRSSQPSVGSGTTSQNKKGWLSIPRKIIGADRSHGNDVQAAPFAAPPQQAPAASRTDASTIFHVTHWKAGSQWIYQILQHCAPDRIVEPQVGESQFLHHPLQAGKIYPTVYVTKQQFDQVLKPEGSRRFVIIRDLRDTLISAYFSIKVSHSLQTWMQDYQRAALQSMTIEDGLIYLMDEWLTGCARIQLSWIEADEPILHYEDLLDRDVEVLERVLLDECQLGVSRDLLREAILANRFEHLAGGRARGQEEITAHARKGISGDWRNYFTERVKRAFKIRYGSLLVASGHERDLHW